MSILSKITQEEKERLESVLQEMRIEDAKENNYQIDGPIEFVIVDGVFPTVGSFVKVSNGFSVRNGEVTKDLGKDAYVIKIGGCELVAHMDYKAWPEEIE